MPSQALIRKALVFAGCLLVPSVVRADHGLTPQPIEFASAGPLAFTPDGILLAGDPKAATVFAIDLEESAEPPKAGYDLPNIEQDLRNALQQDSVEVVDLAVHPQTHSVYASVQSSGGAVLVRIRPGEGVQVVALDKLPAAKVTLPNPPADREVGEGRRRRNPRMESITDLAYSGNRVLVAGLSADDSPSTVLEYEFPFHENSRAFRAEIFHAAHGRVEDDAAIRAFVPINIGGEPSLLAGYTCTPLVQFPIRAASPNQKVRGKTIAELGNRNRPLDMILYSQNDKEYLLIANSARGVMKLATANIEQQAELTDRVEGGVAAGLPFEAIESLEGVVQLDKLDALHAVVLLEVDGRKHLKSIELP